MEYYSRTTFPGYYGRSVYSSLEDRDELVLKYPSGRPDKNYAHKFWWDLQADLKINKVSQLCRQNRWEF